MICSKCGKSHDCEWYIVMTELAKTLKSEIDILTAYVKSCEKAGLSTPEIHPLEDK